MAIDNDMQKHTATYHKVLGVLKYGGFVCVVIAFAVMWLISGK